MRLETTISTLRLGKIQPTNVKQPVYNQKKDGNEGTLISALANQHGQHDSTTLDLITRSIQTKQQPLDRKCKACVSSASKRKEAEQKTALPKHDGENLKIVYRK